MKPITKNLPPFVVAQLVLFFVFDQPAAHVHAVALGYAWAVTIENGDAIFGGLAKAPFWTALFVFDVLLVATGQGEWHDLRDASLLALQKKGNVDATNGAATH